MKKALSILVLALAVACGKAESGTGGGAGGGGGPPPMPVDVAVARADRVVDAIPATGQVEAIQSIDVRPEVSGRIVQIMVREGQEVAKGAPLFKVDDAELKAQVARAEAERDLAAQVMAVHRRLALPADAPVTPIGGAYKHVYGLGDSFVAALRVSNPAANVVAPQLPPVLGAALIALRVCGSTTQTVS